MGTPHTASGTALPLDPALRSAALAEMEAILESPGFRNSEQSKRLLRYLVEHSLEGHWDQLKERAIGVALFGRETGYDSNEDPIVRVRANEIRKRLAKFYLDRPTPSPVRIEVPAGGYRVEFAVAAPEPSPAPDTAVTTEEPRSRRRWWLVAASLMALGTVSVLLLSRPWNRDVLDDFWAPALASPNPVILCSGHPVVYRFTRDFYQRTLGPDVDHSRAQMDAVRLKPSQPLEPSDIVPVPNQYVGLGTAYALARVGAWFSSRHKDFEIRFGNDLSFTDLRKSPAVVVGAFQNRWTIEFTRGLRFIFVTDSGVPGIRDTKTGQQWLLPQLKDDGSTNEDYIVISRISDAETGQFLLAIAPITQYGCQAAGEILTKPAVLGEALRQAGPGWQKRNLQLLYHVQIIGQSPGPPKLVALHEW